MKRTAKGLLLDENWLQTDVFKTTVRFDRKNLSMPHSYRIKVRKRDRNGGIKGRVTLNSCGGVRFSRKKGKRLDKSVEGKQILPLALETLPECQRRRSSRFYNSQNR